jgi:hypothetical protein
MAVLYDMIYDMIYDTVYDTIYDMIYDMMIWWYDMIYLTSFVLTPGGSSTHLNTNNAQNNTIH